MTLRDLLNADWDRLDLLSSERPRPRRWWSALNPRFAPVVLLRTAQRLHACGWCRVAKIFSLLNVLLFGLEVPARLPIGPGLIIPHTHGTVLGASTIGANVTIFQQVTLGATMADFRFDPATRPIVQDDVIIAAGAKVLGRVTLGMGCIVGANAVVLADVPPGRLAVGVPARIIDKQGTNHVDR